MEMTKGPVCPRIRAVLWMGGADEENEGRVFAQNQIAKIIRKF